MKNELICLDSLFIQIRFSYRKGEKKLKIQGLQITTGFFSNAYCSHKNDPILKISSLLGRQRIELNVGTIYSNIN